MHNGFDDLDLDRLRRRRSEKWRLHPPDVLPAFIAEMDYDLAEPVAAALRAAVDLDDCGYATPDGIGETFAAFAATRHGWTASGSASTRPVTTTAPTCSASTSPGRDNPDGHHPLRALRRPGGWIPDVVRS
jgi:bifunctional pyridoxal-dependent enzyme with beta-cystathionase and maltose regulon repressor activities